MFDDLVDKNVCLAISGGPDSMALLNMCFEKGINCVVAHVNYKKRESANRDELLVKKYCEKRNIKMFTLYPVYEQGNFQKWARDVRYSFFSDIVKENKLDCVLVAHHLDDLIETYLIQLKRCTIPSYYGIKKETTIKGVLINRELLNLSKKDLIDYCESSNVPYGIDESNLTMDYTRNFIRHNIVEKMSDQEKIDMISEIKLKNLELNICEQLILQIINDELTIQSSLYLKLKEFERVFYLRTIIYKMTTKRYSIKRCLDIDRQLNTHKNVVVDLFDCIKISKMYNVIDISNTKDVVYSYVFNDLEFISNSYFTLSNKGKKIESLTLSKSDFPITIRSAKASDSIKLRYGTKKINRFFIDKKIPHRQRNCWPVVVNCEGDVIFIPKIGCDLKHYSNNPNCFVLK